MSTKVFISYAHESERLSNDVLNFSNYLRSKGIDSEIDQYEEAPSEGWPKWMMRQIQEADYVLIVASQLFAKRFNDFSGKDDGLGVKWETSLIIQQLYSMNTNNTKFIPIAFKHDDIQHIPLPLQPYTYYNLEEESNQRNLVNRLLGIAQSKRPPLGVTPEPEQKKEKLDEKQRKSMFFSSIIDLDLWNEARWKAMVFLSDPSLRKPPIAGFLFENNEAGEKIFKGLKDQFGSVDEQDEIRISFIRNISDERPQDYKVHISTDWNVIDSKLKKYGLSPKDTYFIALSRIHEMNPPEGSNNLEIFKHSYKHFKKYYITNIKEENGRLVPDFKNLIEKTKVSFRDKSEIIDNPNDEDSPVFGEKWEIPT